ncbi:MAG TPA: alpha/beta hydrolase [Polyangiaceae bacterium]
MVSWALLFVGVAGLLLAVNVLRPVRAPGAIAIPSFFAGWLVGELAVHAVVGQLLVTGGLVALGGLGDPRGVAGAALSLVAVVLLLHGHRRALHAQHAVARALAELPAAPAATAHRVQSRWHVEFHRYGDHALRLDVHRPHGAPGSCPVLVYVHGGGWVIGHRERQGLPLMKHMARRGWVCVSVDYRLSPRATFPDHLVDVKRAIAWVRAHADELGADTSFLALAGNSAGGHLAALAALTANEPRYQPCFEEEDTHVDACVGFYGVYDLLDRRGHWPHPGMKRLLEKHVMKAPRDSARDAYSAASPVDRVHADAPPFLLVHGTHDSLCPVEESRMLFEALRSGSRSPAFYVEVPGAQHAFEVFSSVRTTHVVAGTGRFLEWARARAATRVTAPRTKSGDTPARSSAPPSARRSVRA